MATTYGLPLVVELGIAFDLLITVLLLGISPSISASPPRPWIPARCGDCATEQMQRV